MKRLLQLIPIVLIALGILFFYTSSKDVKTESSDSYLEQFKQDYRIYSPPLPERMSFAGEQVPLQSFVVSEMLDREILVNTYWHSNAMLLFKRAHRWFPIIEPILKAEGVPDDFKYLAVIESGLIHATSPAGAKGFWQLMKSTGMEYGLEINREVDERFHVEKSTKAACKYLKEAYKRFGSWTNAAASYNMGMGGLNRQLTAQGEKSYYDLSLNVETARYVYRILAIKAIFTSPQSYGFYMRECDLYPPLKTRSIVVDTTIASMGDFAHAHDVSYKALKVLNPWLLTTSLSNKGRKKYTILIPAKELFDYTKLRAKESQKIGIYGDKK
jgi:membrane-bound lytic murein transglycosylase D